VEELSGMTLLGKLSVKGGKDQFVRTSLLFIPLGMDIPPKLFPVNGGVVENELE
jgi:hypothetical protein